MPVPQGSKKKASQQFTTLPAELVAAINNLKLTNGKKSQARLLCDRIINTFEENKLSFQHEYVPIPRSYFREIDANYQRVTEPLKDAGILEVLKSEEGKETYFAGSYCKQFRINPKLVTTNFIEATYSAKSSDKDCIDPVTEAEIFAMQRRIKIDKDGADEFVTDMVANLTIDDYRIVSVDDITSNFIEVHFGIDRRAYPMQKGNALSVAKKQQKELFYSNHKYVIDTPDDFLARKKVSIAISYSRRIAKTAKGIFPKPLRSVTNNRITNVMTNTANSLLAFHTVDGERIVSNDLSNSQFTILSYILKGIINNNINIDIKKIIEEYSWEGVKSIIDVRHFSNDQEINNFIIKAEEGKLYEFYEKGLGIKDRPTTKDMMYSIVFGSASYQSSLKTKFKELTPFVLKLIDAFKGENDGVDECGQKHKGSLPVMLQKVEAYVFTERVYAALQASGVWFMTKHDEVLCKESDAAKVKEIIENTLAEIGIKGVVKTDKNVKPDTENTIIISKANTGDIASDNSKCASCTENKIWASDEAKTSYCQKIECHLEGDKVFNNWFCSQVMAALI